MPNFGPVHKLIVHEVGEPYQPLSTAEFEDFEVIHPAECKYEDDHYRCAVGWNIEQGGARWSLHYVGTPITTPGEYAIRAWAETYRGFDYTEHDGGIALTDSDETSEVQPTSGGSPADVVRGND
jgi:hypothetical protein